jgi:hypothetical protein
MLLIIDLGDSERKNAEIFAKTLHLGIFYEK